ncbi:uncharacterized protein LOC129746780 [Uranotaenia lowii]|uniref:uncharacterized protein LOC129746780 n=1 Tax=Uranotaenia lowii TaxID=190385 RepID=UPI002479F85E|nr:uncharacterized protein LOC129746780 [Uranotaenia lowii]
MSCVGDCSELGPPPDMILSMPPPPLSSFLLPRNVLAPKPPNSSLSCIAAFMCEPSLKPNEQSGMDLIELSGNAIDDTWVFVLISSCVGVLLLGALLAMILIKCRDSYNNFSYHDSNLKHPPLASLNDPHMGTTKSGFLPGTILYPTNQQITPDNRTLWATLTPHGTTQHFISDTYYNPEDHYEVIDYGRKHEQYIPSNQNTITKNKNSFENNGFVDYDYEDPTPLMESYNNFDDMDSGYQEPQEVIGTLNRNRSIVSSPTRIENPNLAPLNMYPTHRSNATLNSKKNATLSRRISDIKN